MEGGVEKMLVPDMTGLPQGRGYELNKHKHTLGIFLFQGSMGGGGTQNVLA